MPLRLTAFHTFELNSGYFPDVAQVDCICERVLYGVNLDISLVQCPGWAGNLQQLAANGPIVQSEPMPYL